MTSNRRVLELSLETRALSAERSNRQTRLANQLSILVGVSCTAYLAVYAVADVPVTLLLMILLMGCCLPATVMYLQHHGFAMAARVTLLLGAMFGTAAFSFSMGLHEVLSILQLSNIPAALFLFTGQPRVAATIAGMSAVMFIVMRTLGPHVEPILNLSPEHVGLLTLGLEIGTPVILWLGLMILYRDNVRQEQQLGELVAELRSTAVERERISEELVEREARMRSVMNHALVPIVSMDAGGRIESLNRAAEHLFGYTETELVGRRVSTLVPELAPSATGDNHSGETLALRCDQRSIPIEYAMASYQVAGASKITMVVRDLTERNEAEASLAELSRHAGMAEVATDVLHNVGNTLQSVNVSAAIITESLKATHLDATQRVLETIRGVPDEKLPTFLATDQRGRKALPLLQALADNMAGSRSEAQAELERLTEKIEHIKRVVAAQQRMGIGRNIVEPTNVRDVIEDALVYQGDELERGGITIVRRYADVRPLATDRHRVLQILMNLVKNAREAMAERGGKGTLTVSLEEVDDLVVVGVEDTGVGMSSEMLARVFEHGFTTKPSGHGFGLHGCAIHAQALGGELTAQSAGPMRGAYFELRLPASENRRRSISRRVRVTARAATEPFRKAVSSTLRPIQR